MIAPSPALAAADPSRSVFLSANAGAGKTETLINRVARLLLAGAKPETVLCVTYTKAAAAEMQRRLFRRLGRWAVMKDDELTAELEAIAAATRDLGGARRLFARALETPGGLKIQTIHAFCEALLRRFPLEAGVAPAFQVLDEEAAAEVASRARDDVALAAASGRSQELTRAYAYFSVALSHLDFQKMFQDFEARRLAIRAYLEAVGSGMAGDVQQRCDLAGPPDPEAIRRKCLERAGQERWRRMARELEASERTTDQKLAALMAAAEDFATLRAVFLNANGTAKKKPVSVAMGDHVHEWLANEQSLFLAACEDLKKATVAAETIDALTLAAAHIELYEGAKGERLDFDDLVERTRELLTSKADAAWVLYKLDGGVEHILLDEAQDTAPAQWAVLQATSEEFFSGLGSRGKGRSAFAVADPKQSIFSFQGAVPERLVGEAKRLIGARGRSEQMARNRRSRPEILAFVDEVFLARELQEALNPRPPDDKVVDLFPPRHEPARGAGGCVELWPIVHGVEPEAPDPWRPVDAGLSQSANRLLADAVAKSVRRMVEEKTAVGERRPDGSEALRACRYGDVLILVRRRKALFEEILRALRREGAPVGGADRLRLSEHGLSDDLLALARFALFPADNLSLACLVRGPFCDLSEDDLFGLANGRTGSLWRALREKAAAEGGRWAEAQGFLGFALAAAPRTPPFDFFQKALFRLDGGGRSMRARLLTRLGSEAEDALEAFLARALAAERQQGISDLETFVVRAAASEVEVTREADEGPSGGAGEVRVMTVHGAKGLEAPVVILPDTTIQARDLGGPLLADPKGGFLWAPRASDDCAAAAAARLVRQKACAAESLRLLYVALTRARDRLVICGTKGGGAKEGCEKASWYAYATRAAANMPGVAIQTPVGEGQRFGAAPVTALAEPITPAPRPPPAWLSRPAPAAGPREIWRSPSKATETAGPPAPSPLETAGGLGRWRRGEIIHRLLQILPEVAPEGRSEVAARLVAAEPDLTAAQRDEMAASALAVLSEPAFAAVFAAGSQAEVAVAGAAPGVGFAIDGRIDRLAVTPERVLVVDFKTNRPPPRRIEDADPAYITQLALYGAVLAEVFPGRAIETALLWTDGPSLMPVPENLRRQALAALRESD